MIDLVLIAADEADPQQQGLKLRPASVALCGVLADEADPQQQGLKHQLGHAGGLPGAEADEADPQQQGLKLNESGVQIQAEAGR